MNCAAVLSMGIVASYTHAAMAPWPSNHTWTLMKLKSLSFLVHLCEHVSPDAVSNVMTRIVHIYRDVTQT